MKKIYSKVDSDKLLHIVYRLEEMKSGREDLISPNNFLQLSALKMPEGKTFKPHHHIWKASPMSCIAQESWVVISGKVKVTYYDLDLSIVDEDILLPGDVSITLEGGHNYLFLEDSVVYEYKTGPYTGIENDKVQFG